MRERLRNADKLLRDRRLADAAEAYDSIAEEYERSGFALKAIAIAKQVVSFADASDPKLRPLRMVALQRLIRLYGQLEQRDNAAEAELLLAAVRRYLN